MVLGFLAMPGVARGHTIEEVMKIVMKTGSSTFKTVSSGRGTDADAKSLLEYLKSLPDNKPPKGDLAGWKSRTTRLVQAASDVVAKKPGATETRSRQQDGACQTWPPSGRLN
jgi:hypothetical protein